MIEESGSFLDPLIVVRGAQGGFSTPNGRHRLAAAKVLGLRQITALISPDEALAFRILALNTEKAHNLKDRSLEVIRMARALAVARPRAKESDFASEFEGAELLTLRERGFKSPYLRNYVVARLNPVRFHRAKKGDTKPPMELRAALTRMAASARSFGADSVRERDLALVAAVASD